MERLQKVLAQAGIASRRAAEQIILAGRVRVDGKIVRELGTQVDPRKSRVEVDGNKIVAEKLIYIVLHKPRGVVCTLSDPEGRPTIRELLKDAGARVVPVGRLDFHTSGALLCTNDGEFAQALAHPKLEVPKVYVAKVKGAVDDDALERFGERVMIDGRPTQPAQVKRLRFEGDKTWLEITLREGRNRQVRRLGEATGFPVMRLARISHAGVTSEDLRPGQWRPLSVDELVDLKKSYGVPKKVRAPEFVPAEKVAKGQRRPARPDIRGEVHNRNPKPQRSSDKRDARFMDRDARPGRDARAPRSEGRDSVETQGGRRSGRQAHVPREPARNEFSNRKKPFAQSEFASRKPRAPGERGQSSFSSATKPLQGERGQSPRHDDLDRPWKERSRSAIERRVATNSARPSADRASKHQGRDPSRAQHGGKPRNSSAPAAVQNAKVAGPRKRSAEENQARAQPYVPKSSPRRGTSR